MFNMSFSELLLVAIVSLLVVGPEKLPAMIKKTYRYVRYFRNQYLNMKYSIEDSLDLEDVKADLEKQKLELQKSIDFNETDFDAYAFDDLNSNTSNTSSQSTPRTDTSKQKTPSEPSAEETNYKSDKS